MTSILKADNIQDADGNNIINESGNTITIGASGDTISIPSGATIANSGTATGFGESNTPYFRAYNNASFTFSASTSTKIRMNAVAWESNSGSFSTSNYNFTVPSGEGGKYFLNASLRHSNMTNGYAAGYFFVNDGDYIFGENVVRDDFSGELLINICGGASLSAGDTVDVRVNSNAGTPTIDGSTSYSQGRYSFFEGFKISST